MPLKYNWKKDSIEKFVNAQRTITFTNRFDDILDEHYDNTENGCAKLNKSISDCLTDLADSVIAKSKGLPNRFKKRWFDKECLSSMRTLKKLAKKIPKHRYVEKLANEYYAHKKRYKKLTKSKKLDKPK